LIHYPVPVHLQPAYTVRVPGHHSLSETERAAHHVLSLPLYPELEKAQIDSVIAAVLEFEAAE
jgi:dTDP-4-amino-4,6-dideoxygalactose transaminase